MIVGVIAVIPGFPLIVFIIMLVKSIFLWFIGADSVASRIETMLGFIAWSMGWTIVMSLAGLALGYTQSRLLDSLLVSSSTWTISSSLGWGTGVLIGWLLILTSGAIGEIAIDDDRDWLVSLLLIGALVGLCSGILQGILLRDRILHVGFWIAASSIGFSAAWGSAWAARSVIPGLAGLVSAGAVGGLVSGVITGSALLWLIRHRAAQS